MTHFQGRWWQASPPALLRALFFFLAFLLVLSACSDPPRRRSLQPSSAALSTAHDGSPPGPDPPPGREPDPVCPELGASPSPFPPDLPSSATAAAGAIAGSFSVSSTGEASYSIPLVVPPGRAGMQPSLAVTYDSSAGEGVLGKGFAITGLSAITRCPRNMAQDGEIRAVEYDTHDALCLDGKRLVPVGVPIDPPFSFSREYRTFPDTFAKVVSDFAEEEAWDASKGPKSFKVFTKSGFIVEYGGSPSGRVLAKEGHIRSWWVTRVSDRKGNTIDTSYRSEVHPTGGYTVEHAPQRIDYTGHPSVGPSRAVVFSPVPRP